MLVRQLQFGLDRFSDRKAGHLDRPSTPIISRNTTRGIVMKHIPLTQGKFAIVDDEDYDFLMQWRWHAQKDGNTYYAIRTENSTGAKVLMHRVILQVPRDMLTDHVNFDGLDNRRANIRQCSVAQNQYNRPPRKGCVSKYKGVSWNRGRWHAEIKRQGKTVNLGRFDTEIDAAKAYDAKAKEIQGEFAYLNFKDWGHD